MAQGQDQGIGFQGFKLPGADGFALGIDLHHFHFDFLFIDLLDGTQPIDFYAFGQRFVGFKRVGGHVFAVATVNDEGFVTQAFGNPGGVHGGIAPAVDGYLST